MAAKNEFRTEITADNSQFNAAMEASAQKALTESQRMQSGMRESFYNIGQDAGRAVQEINTRFDGIKAAVEKMKGMVVAVGAVLGGGALFGKMIAGTAAATGEVVKLSRMLGITTQEASALRIALGDIGADTELYSGAIGKLTMKLREGEERFNQLGVATRGSNGELLDGERVMQNTLNALLQFKAGTDRNLASTEFFGKGWAEVQKLMKLTPAIMEEARQKAEALEMTVGPKGAERALVFKRAMNDVKDVGEALANRIGQALMPVLSDLGQWLASIGPAAVTGMRGALAGLLTLLYAVHNGINVIVRALTALLFTAIEPLAGLAEAAALAVTGHWAEAGARLKRIPANIGGMWKNEFEEILKSGDTTRARIAALFDFGEEQGQGSAGPKGGTRTYTPKEEKKESRVSEWEAQLAAQRDAYDRMQLEQGSFQQFSRAMERDYWKRILDEEQLSTQEKAAVAKKYYAVEREIRKEAFEGEIADIKARIERHKQGTRERIELAGEAARRIGERYGQESKEYRQANAEVMKLAEERARQQDRLREMVVDRDRAERLADVELEREKLNTLEQLGAISGKQKLELLRQLKEMEYAVELQALQEKEYLYVDDEVAYRQHLDRIAELQRRHGLEMRKLDGQIAVEGFKPWRTLFDSITNGFSTAIKGVIQGTQTLGQAVRNILQTVVLSVIDMGIKMVAQWVLNAIMGSAIEKVSALSKVGANAAVAASAAFASTAAIPIVGPAMAPAAAAAAYAGAISWAAAIPVAARGWDVPAGINPLTRLHEQEMVLPSDIANPLRDAVDKGGGLGGDVHVHISAVDGESVARLLQRHKNRLTPALRGLARDFAYRGRT